MGIKEIPETYEAFEELLDGYEAEHFGFDEGGRRVADATLALMLTFYPRSLARPMEVFSRALMDRPLLEAFGYRRRQPAVVAGRPGRPAARARAEALLPARRAPVSVHRLPADPVLPRRLRGSRGSGPSRAAARSPHGRTADGRPDGRPDPRVRRAPPARSSPTGCRPGQYDVGRDWPVLTAEVTPRLDPRRWTMTVDGLVEQPTHLDLGRDRTRCRSRSTPATSTA